MVACSFRNVEDGFFWAIVGLWATFQLGQMVFMGGIDWFDQLLNFFCCGAFGETSTSPVF